MKFLCNPWLTLLLRFVLGGAFIYASYHKVTDPADFAKIIYNYKMIPGQMIHLAAMVLPWIELVAGLALITGIGLRAGSFVVGGMALLFIAALSFNLYRCHPTICGCFDTHAAGLKMTDADKFTAMWREIGLDTLFLLMAAQIFCSSFCNRGKKAEDSAT